MTRINALREILDNKSAAIVTGGTNRFYLTGFNSSAGCIVITKNTATLLVDFRYYEKAKSYVTGMDVKLSQSRFNDIKEILKSQNIKKFFIETESTTINDLEIFKAALGEFKISTEPVLSKKLNMLRRIKSQEEIEFIKRSQQITDSAFEYILNFIKIGVSEKEIALQLEFFMRKLGSEGVAFDTIAVSGKNSSLPHGVPTDKPINKGDFLTMDFGAVYNGYCSDMTRTVAISHADDLQQSVYSTVLDAQTAALREIAPNKPCNLIDKTARDIIAKAGYGENFGHGLGHSVGLDIHENPACNTRDTTLLTQGMTMTVEPGIYLPDKFGVRIEDMVVITKDGYQNLTNSPKELIIL